MHHLHFHSELLKYFHFQQQQLEYLVKMNYLYGEQCCKIEYLQYHQNYFWNLGHQHWKLNFKLVWKENIRQNLFVIYVFPKLRILRNRCRQKCHFDECSPEEVTPVSLLRNRNVKFSKFCQKHVKINVFN